MSKKKLTGAQHDLLKPYADVLGAWADFIFNAPDGTLAELREAAEACNMSNCWWAEYAAGQILIDQIGLEQRVRERNGLSLPNGRNKNGDPA